MKNFGLETCTNPNSHNPKKFRYLVHALQSPSARLAHWIWFLQMAASEINRWRQVQISTIDPWKNPQELYKKGVISTSLIDENHRKTWAEVGFILEAPDENVLDCWSQDLWTALYSREIVKKSREISWRIHDVLDANDLLENSSNDNYNEVVITWESDTWKVQIVWVFEKILPDGTPLDKKLSEKIRWIWARLNVPIVQILEPIQQIPDSLPKIKSDYENDLVEKRIWFTFAQWNTYYSLRIFENGKPMFHVWKHWFSVMEWMNREQFQFCVEFIKKNIPPWKDNEWKDMISQLVTAFDRFEYENTCNPPTVTYDDNGKPISFWLVHYDVHYHINLESKKASSVKNYSEYVEKSLETNFFEKSLLGGKWKTMFDIELLKAQVENDVLMDRKLKSDVLQVIEAAIKIKDQLKWPQVWLTSLEKFFDNLKGSKYTWEVFDKNHWVDPKK